MMLPYHLVSAIWAVKRRKPRYLLYSVVFPATLVAALGNRQKNIPIANSEVHDDTDGILKLSLRPKGYK